MNTRADYPLSTDPNLDSDTEKYPNSPGYKSLPLTN